MYKLLAIDCDGTLLNDNKEIDLKTIEMLKKVKERGLKIVLATSKSFLNKSLITTLKFLCLKHLAISKPSPLALPVITTVFILTS